jgi:hypothetical protein
MRGRDSGHAPEPTDGDPVFLDTAGQGRGSSCSHTPMKFFVSAIVFFGTLMAAALVALGAPGNAEVQMAVQAPPPEIVATLFGLDD